MARTQWSIRKADTDLVVGNRYLVKQYKTMLSASELDCIKNNTVMTRDLLGEACKSKSTRMARAQLLAAILEWSRKPEGRCKYALVKLDELMWLLADAYNTLFPDYVATTYTAELLHSLGRHMDCVLKAAPAAGVSGLRFKDLPFNKTTLDMLRGIIDGQEAKRGETGFLAVSAMITAIALLASGRKIDVRKVYSAVFSDVFGALSSPIAMGEDLKNEEQSSVHITVANKDPNAVTTMQVLCLCKVSELIPTITLCVRSSSALRSSGLRKLLTETLKSLVTLPLVSAANEGYLSMGYGILVSAKYIDAVSVDTIKESVMEYEVKNYELVDALRSKEEYNKKALQLEKALKKSKKKDDVYTIEAVNPE